MKTEIVCVLKTGGAFGITDAAALLEGIYEAWPEGSWRLTCVTDCITTLMDGIQDERFRPVPLRHGWPRVWSLVEWWREDIWPREAEGRRVIGLGLDTLIMKPLDILAGYPGPPAGINDLFRPEKLATGVTTWRVGSWAHGLYRAFAARPDEYMRSFRRVDPWLRVATSAAPFARLQNHLPEDYIVSLKAERQDRRGTIHSPGPPPAAAIVCAHGRPRLSSPAAGWAHDLWKRRAGI